MIDDNPSMENTPKRKYYPKKHKGKIDPNSSTTDKEINQHIDKLKHPAEYALFQEFIATPVIRRKWKTQKEFAEAHGLTEDTLSMWKHRKGFYEGVNKLRKNHFDDRIADAINAVLIKTIQGGDGKNLKVLLDYLALINTNIKVEDVTPEKNKLTAEQRKSVEQAFKMVGLSNLIKNSKKDDPEEQD